MIDATEMYPQVRDTWRTRFTPPRATDIGISDPYSNEDWYEIATTPGLAGIFVAAAVVGVAMAISQTPGVLGHLVQRPPVNPNFHVSNDALDAVYDWLKIAQTTPEEVVNMALSYLVAHPDKEDAGAEVSYLMVALITHADHAFTAAGY